MSYGQEAVCQGAGGPVPANCLGVDYGFPRRAVVGQLLPLGHPTKPSFQRRVRSQTCLLTYECISAKAVSCLVSVTSPRERPVTPRSSAEIDPFHRSSRRHGNGSFQVTTVAIVRIEADVRSAKSATRHKRSWLAIGTFMSILRPGYTGVPLSSPVA